MPLEIELQPRDDPKGPKYAQEAWEGSELPTPSEMGHTC